MFGNGLGINELLLMRFSASMANAIGEIVSINFINGDQINGVLFSIDEKEQKFFIIQNPRRFSRTGKAIFLKENKLKVFLNEILYMGCEYSAITKKNKASFETDVDISTKKVKKDFNKKNLVEYKLGEGEELYSGALDEQEGEKWNQFELNEKKYHVHSSYDENKYTTTLNKDLIPEEHKKKTEKIIQEIMNNKESNVHILEDRGIIDENGLEDEEEKYSSVIRK